MFLRIILSYSFVRISVRKITRKNACTVACKDTCTAACADACTADERRSKEARTRAGRRELNLSSKMTWSQKRISGSWPDKFGKCTRVSEKYRSLNHQRNGWERWCYCCYYYLLLITSMLLQRDGWQRFIITNITTVYYWRKRRIKSSRYPLDAHGVSRIKKYQSINLPPPYSFPGPWQLLQPGAGD